MEPILTDVRLALRRLRRSPGFTLFAVASLAVGIGVSTAVYSAARTLLWMPLGVPDEATLVAVTSHGSRMRVMSWIDFQDFRAQQTSASSVAASASIRTALSTGTVSRAVHGEAISGGYFATLGQTPRLGRLIDERDDSTAAPVVVVSDGFWRKELNGDAAILGRTVRLGGSTFEVVGVVGGGFHGLNRFAPAAFWVPATAIRTNPRPFEISPDQFERRGRRAFAVWARLRPGAAVSRFASESATIGVRFDAAYPADVDRGRAQVVPTREWSASAGTRDALDSDVSRSFSLMITSALAVVLLIACTNLANLSLARGTARSQETAVRAALGASRWRLVREQVVESLLVVTAGGAGAAAVLAGLVAYLTTDLPIATATIAFAPEVDASVFAAGVLAAVVAVLVFGLWPAVVSTGSDVRLRLGAGLAATPARWRFHSNLIAWQLCASVALLLVAVMCARVFIGTGSELQRPRYERLALAQIDYRLSAIDELRARELTGAIVEAARRQPGVERVSVSNGSPSSLFGIPASVGTMDDPSGARNRDIVTGMSAIAPDFLETLGIALARGRSFTERDDAGAPRVAIVTEQLARDLFQTADVVGRELRIGSAADARAVLDVAAIVGVTRDITTLPGGLRADRIVFVPLPQRYDGRAPVIILAKSSDPRAAVSSLRTAVRQVDPSLPVSAAGTADVLLAGPLFLLRVIGLLAASLGALALVLAMAGLFGVLSHVVERRTREIGIRLAVGADRGDVVRMVLRDGLSPVLKGLVLGLMIGLGVRIAIRGQVFMTIAAWDPVEFTLLPLIFVSAALVACWLPAWRASRVDPNTALRDL
jgi:predicted permease